MWKQGFPEAWRAVRNQGRAARLNWLSEGHSRREAEIHNLFQAVFG
jgi:hypothetical protein